MPQTGYQTRLCDFAFAAPAQTREILFNPCTAFWHGHAKRHNDVASLQKELIVLVDVKELLTEEERELVRSLVDDAEEKEAEERRKQEEEERRKKEEAKRAREEAAGKA